MMTCLIWELTHVRLLVELCQHVGLCRLPGHRHALNHMPQNLISFCSWLGPICDIGVLLEKALDAVLSAVGTLYLEPIFASNVHVVR